MTHDFQTLEVGVSRSEGINPKGAIHALEKHKTGTEVTVYYNPSNPKQAILHPGISLVCFVPLPFSLLILGFGVFLLMKK